jgi:beta-lactamase class D
LQGKIEAMRKLSWLIVIGWVALLASCTPNNVKTDEKLGKYFEEAGVTGSFALFDNGIGEFTVYDVAKFKDSLYTPASTFKIINSLIALETGRINNEKDVLPWDGVQRENTDWNQDLSLEKAFELSAVPHFQTLALRIGKDTMQSWLDTLGYAAKENRFVINNNLSSFWLDQSAKVCGDEQLGIVKRLYFGQLPFQKRTQDIVRKMMLRESNSNYTLAYKTGLGKTPQGQPMTWVVGWIEENKHPYFFVMHLEGKDETALVNQRLNILKNILTYLNFFEGKR